MGRGALGRLALGALLVAGPLAGCTSGPRPEPTAKAFLAAWSKRDYAAAARLSDGRAASVAATLAATDRALGVTRSARVLGRVTYHSKSGWTTAYSAALHLRGLGDWRYTGTLPLYKDEGSGHWRVHLAVQALHPALTPGQRLGRSRSLPVRAALLDAAGQPFFAPTEVVTVGVQPGRLTDAAATLRRLQQATGADTAPLTAQLRVASPDAFVPVITLRRPDYDRIRAKIHGIPGVVFRTGQRSLAPTATFGRALLGRVGPATAEVLAAAGPAYQAGDELGLSGLQAAYQRQLAGTPSGSIVIRNFAGTAVRTLHTFPGTPGRPVRTTLDRRAQAAAEAALAHVRQPAALVAVRPSTGAVLAVANSPSDSALDRALVGRYPPGSTFKVVSTAALLGRGLRADTPVRCPASITVDGKKFGNFEGEAGGAVPFRTDFAKSCNTAFVSLAPRVGGGLLPATARSFGLGGAWKLPVPAFAGSVPAPVSAVERAATVIGQGRVLASPLGMALVAATAQSGRFRPPVLVTDPAPPYAAPGSPLPPGTAATLQSLMRGVVTGGTAAGVSGLSGVAGKTGTAEYGTGKPPSTHAWFTGFRGDLAFCVLVEGGGVGGRVAAPLAAAFLRAYG